MRAMEIPVRAAHQLPDARHFLSYRAAAVHSVGIKLDANSVWFQAIEIDLNLKDVLSPFGRKLHFAEMQLGPILFQRLTPIDYLSSYSALVCRAHEVGRGRRDVVLLCVFAYRAVGGKAWRQLRHALPHMRDPRRWDPLLIAGIKLRDHLLFEQRIERLSFHRVP